MPKTKSHTNQEADLSEIWKIAHAHIGFVIFITIAFGFIGLTYAMVKPPIWEGSMIIQIGQVGVSNLIESAGDLTIRITHPTYISNILKNYPKVIRNNNDELTLLQDSLRVGPMNGNNLVEIKIRSYSQKSVNDILNIIANQTIKEHNQQMPFKIKELKMNSMWSQTKLLLLRKQNTIIEKIINNDYRKNSTLSKFFSNLKIEHDLDIEKISANVDECLKPENTFTSKIINDIYVSNQPTSVNKNKIVLVFILIGMFSSVTLIVLYQRLKNGFDT